MARAQNSRIPGLDGLRGISILLVLASHLVGPQSLAIFLSAKRWIGDTGSLGVRVFFVISGYLITRLLLEERSRTQSISIRGFYLRRTFRIFPAFLVFVGFVALGTAFGVIGAQPHDFIYALTYTMDFHAVHPGLWPLAHIWSLSVEEQFYLLWPASMALLGTRRSLLAAACTLLIAPLCRYAFLRFLPERDDLILFSFPAVMDSIATGCLLAGFEERLSHPAWKKLAMSPWFCLVPVAVVAANRLGGHPALDVLIGRGIMNIGIALVIHRVARLPTRATIAILDWEPLAKVGTLSYSLYLWQQVFLDRHNPGWWCRFPLNLVLAFFAAGLSYRLVEQPMLRARVRWFGSPKAKDRGRQAASSS